MVKRIPNYKFSTTVSLLVLSAINIIVAIAMGYEPVNNVSLFSAVALMALIIRLP